MHELYAVEQPGEDSMTGSVDVNWMCRPTTTRGYGTRDAYQLDGVAIPSHLRMVSEVVAG